MSVQCRQEGPRRLPRIPVGTETPMTPETQNPTDLFERVVTALNDRDFERFRKTHADDVVLHDHDESLHGIDAVIEHEQRLFEAFPDMRYDVESIVADGNHLMAHWTVTGTHENEFQGLQPTGRDVEIPAMGALTVENGLCSNVRLVYDRFGLMEQLGILESPTP